MLDGARVLVAVITFAAISPLSACGGSLGVVGIERRTTGDAELEIVGPYASAAPCRARRGAESPETHAALDERCPNGSSGAPH